MYEIKKAEREMLGGITKIENEAFTCPWSEKTFDEALESETISFFAALSGETVCGFYCLMTIEDEAELLNIAVSSSCRRTGCGSALMAHMAEKAAEKNVKRIYLEVRNSNLPAQSLYKKFGFFEVGVRRNYYAKPREDAVIMQKNL